MKRLSFIIIFFLSNSFLCAQEIISVLEENPLLRGKHKQITMMKMSSAITLPFIDDFSYESTTTNVILWEKNSVFVNRSYPVNPVTLGVATFDGLKSDGMPYDISLPNTWGPADTLTSRTIDLDPNTSVYLLFYYQAEGLGDNPQPEDSLVLEFSAGLDTIGNPIWKHIWSITGQTTQEFQKKEFILDSIYLHSNFRFRFRNYATLSGNYDHWHIDYVKVDEYISAQIPALEDVAFVYENPQLLKRYREMPWVQYLEDPIGELIDTLDIILRNNDANLSVDYQYDVFENNLLIEHYPYLGTMNSTRNVQVGVYDSIGNFLFIQPPVFLSDTIFQSTTSDSVTFLFQNVIKTSLSDYKQNDTLVHLQKFKSHYSYDDGIAEFAYGINVQGAKMAYQFKLNKADSLRIIQIYFAPMQYDISNVPFHLVVWNDNNGLPGNILYKSGNIFPIYEDRIEFHNYYLDSIIGLDGTFYVGVEQTTNDMLNIGLDRNSLANDYMFYNVGGGWNNSQFPGAWMIRPVLRRTPIISSVNAEIIKNEILIYPNPFSSYTTIKINNELNSNIKLFNISGRLLKEFNIKDNTFVITRSILNSGLYFIQIQNDKGIFRKKLVIQ